MRKKNRSPWTDLVDRVASTKKKERKNLLQEFDEIADSLSTVKTNSVNLAILAIRYCLNWSVKDIALCVHLSEKQVADSLYRTKKKINTTKRKLASNSELNIKLDLVAILWQAGGEGIQGSGYRNLSLMREAISILKLIALQHPQNVSVYGSLTMLCYVMAQILGDPSILPYIGSIHENRENWDRNLILQGDQYFKMFKKLNKDPLLTLRLDTYHLIFSPPSSNKVNWKQVMKNQKEIIKLRFLPNIYLNLVKITGDFEGPLKGAQLLEQCKGNAGLKNHLFTYIVLGRLYFRARKWRKAGTNLRIFLKMSNNELMKAQVKTWILACKNQISKRGSKN